MGMRPQCRVSGAFACTCPNLMHPGPRRLKPFTSATARATAHALMKALMKAPQVDADSTGLGP
eukprot:1108262-Prymnesium_polylepis.2